MTIPAAGRYTWDDFIDLHEDDPRELIDGELVETEVPSKAHEYAVVEIISPSNRGYDRVTKLRGYAELGVPEYWVVDPAAHTVERLVLAAGNAGTYVIAASLRESEVFRPDSFEGLEIPLPELWT